MHPKELCRVIRENIRSRRNELGLTQKAVADACDFTQPGLARIESGASVPSVEALAMIAEALSTTPDALLSPGIFSQKVT